jgi:hypothetical protein
MTNTDSTSSCLKAEKSVSFRPYVFGKSHLHIGNYTDEEIRDCWFNQEEMKYIKQELRRTISMIDKNLKLDEKKYCIRGTEGSTKRRKQSRLLNRMDAVDAVFNEQDIQYKWGVWDDCKVATLYSEASHTSKMEAKMLGASDAKIALTLDSRYNKKKNAKNYSRYDRIFTRGRAKKRTSSKATTP